MGNPYTRNDTPNNIDDGNIIEASDFDGEFDKLEDAFDGSAGHTHDGTTGEGGPITTLGPAQEVLITATTVEPATTNTVDLGTATKEWKDLHLKGDFNMDGTLTGAGTASFVGTLTVDGSGAQSVQIESTNAADSYLDLWRTGANSWRVMNDGGILKFHHGSSPAAILTNTWFQIANTGVATFTGNVFFEKSSPALVLKDTGGTAGLQISYLVNDSDTFSIQTRDDSAVFIASDYSIPRDVNGATQHRWSTGGVERMRLDSSGNLGVGTTTPATRLDVNGAATVRGQLVVTTNLAAGGFLSANGDVDVGAVLSVTGESHLNGHVGITTPSPTAPLDVNGDTVRVRSTRTPASASATGNAGDICWDADYIYVCTSTNTWKRAALSTW